VKTFLASVCWMRLVVKMMSSTVLYPKILPMIISVAMYGARCIKIFLFFSLMMVAKKICVRLLKAKSIRQISSFNSSWYRCIVVVFHKHGGHLSVVQDHVELWKFRWDFESEFVAGPHVVALGVI
jgi:hypothetical protein